MNDRELLEFAAKAAGIELKPMEMVNVTEQGDDRFIGYMADPTQCPRGWFDPLRNDGDALRLAVKLGLRLELDNEWRRSHVQQIPNGQWFAGPHGTDPYAATRRAIVRAAAEIGRSKT